MSIKVLHVITGLATGGAEGMLYRLLDAMDRARFESTVVSLLDRGSLGEKIEAVGIPVHCMGMRRGLPTPRAALILRQTVHRWRPDIVHGWMYHGNLAAIAAAGGRRTPVLWNVRHSLHDLGRETGTTRLAIRAGALLSSWPERIVYNAWSSARQHEECGYRADKTVVIPNGFDCDRFRPDLAARARLRAELGLPETALLVGMVARYHPTKNHAGFLQAAARVRSSGAALHFILVGREVDSDNRDLVRLVCQFGLQDRVHCMGERRDIPEIMAGLDLLCLPSHSEGFPNVVGEAMACGVPCVATDVGDSALVVADCGSIVPRDDPEALAVQIDALLELGPERRLALGRAARERIIREFSLSTVVRRYQELYAAMALAQ